MSGAAPEEGADTSFAAFRDAVFADHLLLLRLREPKERDSYVAHVVAVGAGRGFRFDDAEVHAAMREGKLAWLAMGADPP